MPPKREMEENSSEVLIRDPQHYPENLKVTLNLLTINQNPQVVGSAAYMNHKYPSDVDVFEKVTVRLSRENAIQFYADQFKNILQKVVVDSQVYYLDFKAGQDYRFNVPISPDSIVERIALVQQLKPLLTNEEQQTLIELVPNYEKFKEALRQHQVIRWTPEEVIQGYKLLPGNAYINFSDAIGQSTIVKLDVLTWIQTRFQSIEVFYNLQYIDPETGALVEFYPLGSYRGGLIESIQKYSSEEYYNPLKVAKRLWTLARITECGDLLRALNPLIGSDAAALNQIDTDAEILIDFIFKSYTLPKTGFLNAYDYNWSFETIQNIFTELLGFRKRLANHLDGPKFAVLSNVNDTFFEIWLQWQKTGIVNRGAIIERLYFMRKELKDEIVLRSQNFLDEINKTGITCPNPEFSEITAVQVQSAYE